MQTRLLRWFDQHQRELPWRETRDPYRTWVSEIMLQQTRVEAVIPYYRRWLKQFPTIRALAQARPSHVLKAWEGLGYYSRARNLHAAARRLTLGSDGKLPQTAAELRELPGIGRYTAGAIASIAFDERAAVVDGNVSRVMARLFAIRSDIRKPATHETMWSLAESLLPGSRVGDWNQAIMELGALVCVPKSPRCPVCPLREACQARARNLQNLLPRRGRLKRTSVTRLAAIVRRGQKILLIQRPRDGRLNGFWELPSVEVTGKTSQGYRERRLNKGLRDNLGLTVKSLRWERKIRYAITRFDVTMEVFVCMLRANAHAVRGRWINAKNLRRLTLSAADRQALAAH